MPYPRDINGKIITSKRIREVANISDYTFWYNVKLLKELIDESS